ncbi:MAG TPA: biotin/lipoyl-containing protein [Bacteroidales bacterium]|nr:biotin/lipoyl-containing protein [Bacteroidales bacterium]
MDFEIKLDDRLAKVELLKKENDRLIIKVDDRKYDLDIAMVEDGVYSILFNGKSYNVELVDGENSKKYIANTFYRSFDVEIVDAETRYMLNRNQGGIADEGNTISSPMPGKVVKILVNEGDEIEAGEPLIIVSAMKMESEYKSGKAGKIKQILVNEGQTVAGNEPLIIIE